MTSIRHLRARLLACASMPIGILAAAISLPKSHAYADPLRLGLTVATFLALVGGASAVTWAYRAYRDEALRQRFQSTAAVRDTIQFLLHERQQARRGRCIAVNGVGLSLSLSVLSYWPQLAPLNMLSSLFSVGALVSGIALLAQPVYARRSIINALFLRRYLRQQVRHLGAAPAPLAKRSRREPPVQVTGRQRFRAGGFEWQFDDWAKNALILGQPGSGKTISVINAVLDGVLAASNGDLKISGVIFDPKGAFCDTVRPLCRRLSREDDLHIISIDAWPTAARTHLACAWNPLDTSDSAVDVAARMITTAKLAGGLQTKDTFFLDSARIFMRHAFELLRAAAAPEPTDLLAVHRLCNESVDEAPLYSSLVETLAERFQDQPAPPAIDLAIAYFEDDWAKLPDRQRAGVRSTLSNLIDDFSSDSIAGMISGRSTLRIADLLDEGKILYVHLPLAEHERVSRILTSLLKLELQREVLRRVGKKRPSFLLGDEYQSIFVSGEGQGDSDFFERSRESRHANIVAAQNLSSFLKKTDNRSDVINFLGLCAVKIFLRNAERETNEYASHLFGQRSEIIVTASEAARLDGALSRRNQTSYSRSTRTLPVVPADAFANLAIPVEDDPAQQFAESIVHLGSRAATGRLDLAWPVYPLPR